jgi:hypothetical protein
MISIIICSVNKDFLRDVSGSIRATIGVDHEILIWDNKGTGMGLCEVYNRMAVRAKYPYLCFLHEDILFRTNDWGKILLTHFERDPAIGLIGVAGSKYKSRTASGWYSGFPEMDRFNIIHKHRSTGEEHHWTSAGPEGYGFPHRVVCIDGVLMACRKSVWEQVRFDDNTLKGFHFYDIDFSVRAAAVCEVVALVDIDIVHITFGGDYGDPWIVAALQYHQGRKSLPAMEAGTTRVPENIERSIARGWLDRLKSEKITLKHRGEWVFSQHLAAVPALWYSVLKFMIYQPLHLRKLHSLLKRRTGQ